MADESPCDAYTVNQLYLDATEHLDDVIADKSQTQRRLFFNMIPRGAFPLGEGLIRTKSRFYSGLGDMAGLGTWRETQVSRPESHDDPGFDACRYESTLIQYGFEQTTYKLYETFRRSVDVCLNDVKFKWQFEQQLKLMFSGLAEAALSVWENMGREAYLYFAGAASRIFVLAGGSPDSVPLSTTYNPFTSSNVVIPRGLDIGRIDWSVLDWFHLYLSMQCRSGALAVEGNMPVFGLVVDPWDFDFMIRNNADIREDFRYGKASVLLSNYGTVDRFRGFSLLYDMETPRYAVKSIGATTITLERVLPRIEAGTTVGNKTLTNTDYLNAEYGMMIIMVNKVYSMLIPPSGPASPGGGTKFGAVPGLNGAPYWLNIPDRCENPLSEKGFYMMRFQGSPAAEDNSLEAIGILYKRCPQTKVILCEPCETVEADWQAIVSAVAAPVASNDETALLYTQVKITLAACLNCEMPGEIGIDYNGTGGANVVAVVVDDSEAPTYTIAFESAAAWIDAAAIVAGTSTVLCGATVAQ